MKRDTSEFYTPERALAEDVEWIRSGIYKKHLAFLLPLMEEHHVKTVLEVGCGSGLLANVLPDDIEYTGIDKNTWMLDQARRRNSLPQPQRRFVCWDARNWNDAPRELAMAWQFMKNFGLEEWDKVLGVVLAAGRHAAFDVQVFGRDVDNGHEHHHTFVSEEHLKNAIIACGHREAHREVLSAWNVMNDQARCVAVWTTKVEKEQEAA